MHPAGTQHRSTTGWMAKLRWERVACAFAWLVVLAALVNVLVFALTTANPVLRSDDWYFFHVFVSKAIDGTLGFADFFVKRMGADHAQPLSKAVLWFEWRYLDLDVAFESLVGVVAAFGCGLILHRFVMASRGEDRRNALRQLAWGTVCVLLLSLNAAGIWTWPLVALGYLTLLPAFFFIWATWCALRSRRLHWLVLATLVLGIVGDDSAIIVVLAVLLALLLVLVRDVEIRDAGAWKVIVVMVACLALARIGYAFAPVAGGFPKEPLAESMSQLVVRMRHGEWWQWLIQPLAYSVAYDNPFTSFPKEGWKAFQWVVAVLLVAAHVAFWLRAFRGRHNLTTFAAVSLMLLTYGWLAGILLYRVSHFGAHYLHQERYVQLYAFNLVALLLMWTAPRLDRKSGGHAWALLPTLGCILLLAIQVPLARHAWRSHPYLLAYYRQAAMQIEMVANYPDYEGKCLPVNVVCEWPRPRRAHALQTLRQHELNVFSPRLQAWYSYLPKTGGQPVPQDALRSR